MEQARAFVLAFRRRLGMFAQAQLGEGGGAYCSISKKKIDQSILLISVHPNQMKISQQNQPFRRPVGVDLFAGAGGMSLGFEQAGFDVVAAVEIDPISRMCA